MAAPIGPGDWVECVDIAERCGAGLPPNGLRVGAIYQVITVFVDLGTPGVTLAEVRSWHRTGGYRADHFRPIYRPKQSLIDTLKAPPKHARKREEA